MKHQQQQQNQQQLDSHLPSFCHEKLNSISSLSIPINFDISRIVAPCVGQSDLAFRMMTRFYGATACYTPMLDAKEFSSNQSYRQSVFHTCPNDRPLLVQFASNDTASLINAATYVSSYCDAIDLNLGCPKADAKRNKYGSYLCDKKDWMIIYDMLSSLRTSLPLNVAVTAKIRLLPTLSLTYSFILLLISAGVSLIAIHARYRGSWKRRREGLANLEWIKLIIHELRKHNQYKHVKIISNGNIRSYNDIINNEQYTSACGQMSACGVLSNPAIFSNINVKLPTHVLALGNRSVISEYLTSTPRSTLTTYQLISVYFDYCDVYDYGGIRWVQDHVWNILRFNSDYHPSAYSYIRELIKDESINSIEQVKLIVKRIEIEESQVEIEWEGKQQLLLFGLHGKEKQEEIRRKRNEINLISQESFIDNESNECSDIFISSLYS